MISISLLIFIFMGCMQQITQQCPVTNPQNPLTGNGTITGKVSSDTRMTIEGVKVSVGSVVVMTNNKGEFILSNIPCGDRVLVNFTCNGYSTTQKVVEVKPNRTSFVEASVKPITLTQNINPATGGSVQFAGAKVTFLANSFVDFKGRPFTGSVKVNATYFDPTSKVFLNCFQGEFKGVRTDNSETAIESFGFINVEILNGNDKLQIAEGKTATISLPIPAKLASKAPQTIPLWYYDETKGKWFEEGTATKTGTNYIGYVKHFTSWNCDQPTETSFLQGRVIDQNGNPLSFAYVRTFGVDYTGSSIIHTDDNGNFKTTVKSSATAQICASYFIFHCDTQTVSTPVTGQTTDIGNLVITVDTSNICYLTGRYIDVGGLPIKVVTVRLADSTNKLLDYTFTNNDGVFRFMASRNTKYIISTWIQPDSGKVADTVTVPNQGGTYDVGNITLYVGGTIVNGRVVDSTGTPLPNVSVVCKDQQMFNGQREMQTDASGQFSLWLKPNVTFSVTFLLNTQGLSKTISDTSPALGETKDLGDIQLP